MNVKNHGKRAVPEIAEELSDEDFERLRREVLARFLRSGEGPVLVFDTPKLDEARRRREQGPETIPMREGKRARRDRTKRVLERRLAAMRLQGEAATKDAGANVLTWELIEAKDFIGEWGEWSREVRRRFFEQRREDQSRQFGEQDAAHTQRTVPMDFAGDHAYMLEVADTERDRREARPTERHWRLEDLGELALTTEQAATLRAYMDGATLRELGEQLGISHVAVRKRLHGKRLQSQVRSALGRIGVEVRVAPQASAPRPAQLPEGADPDEWAALEYRAIDRISSSAMRWAALRHSSDYDRSIEEWWDAEKAMAE